MYIVFDYLCPSCGNRLENKMVRKSEMDSQHCNNCATPMTRLPAGTRTTFRYADGKLKK